MRVYLTVKQFLLLLQCNRCWKNSWDSTVSITAWVPVRMLSWMRRPFTYFSSVPSFFFYFPPCVTGCGWLFFTVLFFIDRQKKKNKTGVYMCEFLLDWNWICSFIMLVLISLDNNALTVQFLVDRQGTITFGFFFKLKIRNRFQIGKSFLNFIGWLGSRKSDSAWIQQFPTVSTVLNWPDIRIFRVWRNYCLALPVFFIFTPTLPHWSYHTRECFNLSEIVIASFFSTQEIGRRINLTGEWRLSPELEIILKIQTV